LIIYSVLVLVLAIIFGLLWVEVAGLNPANQAQQLIESGFEVPGFRKNPKILEQILAKYIYPLTVLSSIIVALIAIISDILGAYGSGTGLLLAVGILQQYYALIAYERTLESYPLLRRIIGE
ncbi:MAG: preprotein translocase subunit SecY, partial [Desulfurococcaceae archaeon]